MAEDEGLQIRWVEAEMQAVSLRPGDIIVLMCPSTLSDVAIKNMREAMQYTFPGHRWVVLEEGMRLGVLRPTEEPA